MLFKRLLPIWSGPAVVAEYAEIEKSGPKKDKFSPSGRYGTKYPVFTLHLQPLKTGKCIINPPGLR
ncbi:hypothetical protein A4D02_32550 [Niastella koreensis]|uniref:Uncharacterized protein n=2 Tax=Niastella koreensis TaxID=354356 RepID=G8T7C7_NIAKG|nr:hypothetical protein Niako_4923 [Niastella koreensis GR20-10]OQP45930.1 hypothetical protein A4D02_32550 [Niastella koreensis]